MVSVNVFVGSWTVWVTERNSGQLFGSLPPSHHKGIALSPTLRKPNTHKISSMATDKLEGDFSHYRKIVNFSKGFATGFL